MKKILACILTAALCLCCLASCDSLKHEHIPGEWQHDESQHWRSTDCTRDKCDIEPLVEEHVGESSDGICDVCGREEEYIFELDYEETGYVLVDIGPGYIGGDVVIPSEYRGLPVTGIGMYAFGNSKDNLTSVTIPDSVKEIGMKAFAEQDNLETVTIGNGTTSIDSGAFEWCPKLKTVVIGDGTEYIYAGAFAHCESLESVTLGKNVKEITGYVFSECPRLKTITIPASIEKIGAWCFEFSGFTDIYFGVSAPGENWHEEWDNDLEGVNIHWNETGEAIEQK